MSMIFLYIRDQEKVRIQHNNHVLVFLALVGSCTTKECKTGQRFIPTYRENLKIDPVLQMQVPRKTFLLSYTGPTETLEKKNPFSINIKVGVYCYIIFFKRFGATYFLNFEQWMFRRIFYDFHYLNFLLEVMVKSTRRVWGHFVTLNYVKTPCLITWAYIFMPLTQSLATPESAHSGLWRIRELRVLLLFHGRDVGPFHGRTHKKNENEACRVEREDMEGTLWCYRSTGCQVLHSGYCDLKFNDLVTNDNTTELV